MTNRTKLLLIFFILTVASIFPIADWLGIEIRSYLLTALYNASFFICFALFLMTVFFVTIKVYKTYWHLLIVIFVPILFLMTCVIGLFIASRPVYWQDNAIFKNSSSEKYLIYQTFWFGITADNPKCRPILTTHKDRLFRKITVLSDSIIPYQIIGGYGFNFDSIPKTIDLQGETYSLIDLPE